MTSSLWTPGGPPSKKEMEVDSNIELHDSDIIAMEYGPLAWAQQQSGRMLDIDRFTKDVAEQFERIGFQVEVQVWDTNERGVWAFKVLIEKRIGEAFDPDRQVHEVVSNLLEIPGEGGTIDTGKAMLEMERRQKEKRTSKGGHFNGH